MSHQAVILETFTSSTFSDIMSVEMELYLSLPTRSEVPTPDAKATLASFRKPRTKKPINATSDDNSKVSSATPSVERDGITQIPTTSNSESGNSISKPSKSSLEVYINEYVQRLLSSDSISLATNQDDTTPRKLSREPSSLRRRSSLPALALRTSNKPSSSRRSNSMSEESHRLPSWESFWEHSYDSAFAQNFGQSRCYGPDSEIIQTTVHHDHRDSEQPHLGKSVDDIIPTNKTRKETVDHNPLKKLKNATAEKKSLLKRIVRRIAPKALPPKIQTSHGAEEEVDDTSTTICFLNLPYEISPDKSEIEFLRRMQDEEILEFLKQRLFSPRYAASYSYA